MEVPECLSEEEDKTGFLFTFALRHLNTQTLF